MLLRLVYFFYRIYIFLFRPVTYGVRALLVKDGRILLIRHTYRSGWHLPGGGIQRGETVETAARREVREETGAEMGAVQLLGIYSNLDGCVSGHNILFACEVSWRLMRERMLADKPAIHELWRKLFALRRQVAANADKPDTRAYVWEQKSRFDYTPRDCRVFHTSIEKVVVPAASRVYERRRKRLGIETIRPWDEYVDPLGRTALRPFRRVTQLASGAANIFDRVDPTLGQYFRTMMAENLLDLKSRKHKADGAFCAFFELTRKPFVFMNAVGIHYDVQTLLHESGHAFHSLEMVNLPYGMQRNPPMEFQEIASLGMELLAAPYLTDSGLYTPAEAARARIETLEDILLGWPYMALVDAFQHWIYENPTRGADPKKCDAKWSKLHARFIPDVDYSGIEIYRPTQWHHQGHILQSPFYYIEYGMAQLGAVQVWANALKDQAAAVQSYRHALSLGATASLPELYAAAGAKLAFDRKTLQSAVDLIETQIAELEKVAG